MMFTWKKSAEADTINFTTEVTIPVQVGLFDSSSSIVQLGQRVNDIVGQPPSCPVPASMDLSIESGKMKYMVTDIVSFPIDECQDTGLELDQWYVGIRDRDGIPRLVSTGNISSSWSPDKLPGPDLKVGNIGFMMEDTLGGSDDDGMKL